jgi:acyl-CoA hydrolase
MLLVSCTTFLDSSIQNEVRQAMEMEAKRVAETRITMSQMMSPQDANVAGNVHGGVIMKLIDVAGGVVAFRHCRSNVVTASIERLDLLLPIFIGDLVTLKASLNLAGRTSMEIGVRVEAENLRTGEIQRAASAYLTYVALGEDSRPTRVPPLILETEEDIRRNCEAKLRREARLQSRSKARTSC